MAPAAASTAPLLRAAAVRNTVLQNARMAPRYARAGGAGHGQRQASGHAVEAASEQYPAEGFNNAFWRNTILAVVLSFATYRLSLSHAPSAKPINLDESHDPEDRLIEAKDTDMPYLTRYLAYHMPREGLWKERNDKHFELTVRQAEDKLLLQDAQRPKIRRFRYSGTFEQASPHGIPVGSTVDLSDLKLKTNLNAPVGED